VPLAAGNRGDWILIFQKMAVPQAGLSGRVWMIDKKDESLKLRQ
jgi:hypothetical protein